MNSKLDLNQVHVPSISKNIAEYLIQGVKEIESSTKHYPESYRKILRDEFETWELINELIFIDALYFMKQNDFPDNLCPKTAQYWLLIKDHSNLVVQGATHWLQKIYQMSDELLLISSNHLDSTQSTCDDFDCEIDDKNFLESEADTFRKMFEYLRAGKIVELQQKLNDGKCFDKLLLLNGSIPMFDNVKFEEQVDYGGLIDQDLQRESNINEIQYNYEETHKNVVIGNRNYFLNLLAQNAQIKERQYSNSQEKASQNEMRNAIHGVQVGNLDFIISGIKSLNQQQPSKKDYQWAFLKAFSARILINKIIYAKKQQELMEYETFYTDMWDESLYNNEAFKDYQDIPNIQSYLDELFKKRFPIQTNQTQTWFEKIQTLLILTYAQSSLQQNRGINLWDKILDELFRQTSENPYQEELTQPSQQAIKQEEHLIKLRFIAHFAIILLLLGRVSDNCVAYYNNCIQTYMKKLAKLKEDYSTLKQIAFYAAFIIGENILVDIYSKILIKIKDSNLQSVIIQENEKYFNQILADKIIKAVIEQGVYQEEGEKNFLNAEYEKRRDNLQFIFQLSPEDQEAIEVQQWAFKKKEYLWGLASTNETARKFLILGQIKNAEYLLNVYQKEDLNNPEFQLLYDDRMSHPSQFTEDWKKMQIVSNLREREKIKELIRVLLQSESLLNENVHSSLNEEAYLQALSNLINDCQNLLFGDQFIIRESEAYLDQLVIRQDSQRILSVELVCKKYCYELLQTILECKIRLEQHQECLGFLTDIDKRGRNIREFLTNEDYYRLMCKVTDIMMECENVMYELICLDDNQ